MHSLGPPGLSIAGSNSVGESCCWEPVAGMAAGWCYCCQLLPSKALPCRIAAKHIQPWGQACHPMVFHRFPKGG